MPDEEHLTAASTINSQGVKRDPNSMPTGAEKAKLIDLAEAYRQLAHLKRMVLRKVN